MPILSKLTHWSDPAPLDQAALADIAQCRALLRDGSSSFFAASLLLPRAVRNPASALYAFCRLADDAVDTGWNQHAALAQLRERLHAAYEGRPGATAADRALAAVVARFRIPRALPEALLEGFAWDLDGRKYETLAEVQDYGARVAGTVGAMMALLMGVRSAEGLARACDLGVAMQLSNIARDVGEDARMGRIYLPRQWLREAGIDPDAWLVQPVFNAAIATTVQRVLEAAQVLYDRVDAGIAQLPLACRPGINAARYLYAEIGREVERRGFDSVSARARVAPARKAGLMLRAALHVRPDVPAHPAPVLEATRFLVDACKPVHVAPGAVPAQIPWWDVAGRVVWVLQLFERLERQEQARYFASTVVSPACVGGLKP